MVIIKLKIIKKIIFLTAVILVITAVFKWTKFVYSKQTSKYEIFIDVEDSKLFLLEDGKLKKEYKCSGGKWSTPSPIGTWKITFKGKWGEGFRPEGLWDLMYHGEILEYMELLIQIL